MSSLLPWPRRTTIWKCPKCGRIRTTVDGPPPWIMTCLPFFGGRKIPPTCPKCKIKMERETIFTV